MTYTLDSIAGASRDLAFQVEQVLISARSSAGLGLELHFAEAMMHMPDQIWTVPCPLHPLLLLPDHLAAQWFHAQAPK
jgi:hypothetical protein